MTTNKTKVAIYIRVGSQEQLGIGEQLRALRNYCDANGKEIYAEYVDEGVSGINMEGRHSLQRLLKDAEKQEFHEVIVWKLNRLARNTLDVMNIIRKLDDRNITFRSITEKCENSTPTGKFVLQMIAQITKFNLRESMRGDQQ